MLIKISFLNMDVNSKLEDNFAYAMPAIPKKGIIFTTLHDTLVIGLETSRETPSGTNAAPERITRTKKKKPNRF
jgi:hypothetical protein